MNQVPFISNDFINSNTNYKELVSELRQAFSANTVIVPQRHHHDFPNSQEALDSSMLLMPAWDPNDKCGVKIVTISPNNGKYGLPTIEGVYLYFESQKGQLQAILEAKSLTNKRTAAASALASDILSRKNAKSLLMVGTGALSTNLIEAHASVRAIEKVYVYGRDFQKATHVANSFTNSSFTIEPVQSIKETISEVDIISCATLSKDPLIEGKWLSAGQHLDMVGAYKVDMREADDEVLLRSSVFVDNMSSAIKETGDLAIPLMAGTIEKEDIRADLFSLCATRHRGRTKQDEITFFKSVGHALEDLIGAKYYYSKFIQ
jgi:ornithine cyclodeaminase/alanine dehydrogenase-like protein (mu-crystallin family)